MPGLIYPIGGTEGRISSTFGRRRSPGGIGSTNHQGIDIAAPRGTPVLAPSQLRVIRADAASKSFGKQIVAQDVINGTEFRFAHLDTFNVAPGQIIRPGAQIGTVGSTGTATGPNLHLETRVGGKLIDPLKILKGAAKKALDKGKNILDKATGDLVKGTVKDIIGNTIPGADIALDVIGIGGDSCGIICQFQNWIKDSGFFQRLALALVALILIASAFFLMKPGVVKNIIPSAK